MFSSFHSLFIRYAKYIFRMNNNYSQLKHVFRIYFFIILESYPSVLENALVLCTYFIRNFLKTDLFFLFKGRKTLRVSLISNLFVRLKYQTLHTRRFINVRDFVLYSYRIMLTPTAFDFYTGFLKFLQPGTVLKCLK